MLSTIRVILVTGTIFLLSACGRGGGGSDAGAVPEPPSVIRISDTTLRDISPGDTFIYDLDGSYTEYDWDGVTVINSVDIDTTLDRACFSTQTSVNGQPALSMKTTFGTGESSTLRLFQDSAGSLFEYAENTEDGYVSFSSPPPIPQAYYQCRPLWSGAVRCFSSTSDYTYWIHPAIGVVKIDFVETYFYRSGTTPVSSIEVTAILRSTNIALP